MLSVFVAKLQAGIRNTADEQFGPQEGELIKSLKLLKLTLELSSVYPAPCERTPESENI